MLSVETNRVSEDLVTLHAHSQPDSVARGMIKLVVKEAAQRAGIKSAKELSDKAGLHYQTCRLIWHGETKMIGLGTIDSLCKLLKVPPCQLFDFKDDSDK